PGVLKEESELELLKKLCELPEEIRLAAISREPARITRYSIELATAFHSFYNACRVKCEDEELMGARLKLCASVGTVLRGILKMLKIDAPEQM
ncbi:MAG: arginine--tRNA ligase, partial [Clostridia bacterium]|nr:arginine--tRNA ligase [Clostridia bacterium]